MFGLSGLTSDGTQIIAYRDAQDRAAKLGVRDEAEEVFTAAMRSDDKTLAAAVLSKAIANGWNSIVAQYVERYPDAGEQLEDLADLQRRYISRSFINGVSYIA